MDNRAPASNNETSHTISYDDYDLDGQYNDDESKYPQRPQLSNLRTIDGKCLNCCDINFEDFFSLTSEKTAANIASISVECAKITAEFCPFCKLLIDTVAQLLAPRTVTSYRGDGRITFYFKRVYSRGVWDDVMFKRPSAIAMKVTLRPAPWPFKDPEIYFTIYPIFKGIVDDRLHSGRFVDSTSVDLKVAEQWLTSCDALHGDDCSARSYLITQQRLPNFRVIDVKNMCVQSADSSYRYVALSYVWGRIKSLMLTPSNIELLYRAGSLIEYKHLLPKTIRDAMQVVREIGERYLWVDCLCILQSGEEREQIQAMDNIFGSACLTIIAACGVDASMGLTGVDRESRRVNQLSWAVTTELTIAVALQNPNEIMNAAWSSRGWTLQEALLGKRFLMFRDGQMLWQCRHGIEFEDTLAENKAYSYQSLQQLPQTRIIDVRAGNLELQSYSPLLRPRDFKLYASVVQDYTHRLLTEDIDILNAFGGLSKVFEVMFGARMLSGLPESYFDIALLWQPKVMLKRRDVGQGSFPSWSWAGWLGEIGFSEVESDERSDQEGVVPLLRWSVRGSKNDSQDREQLTLLNGTGIGIDETALNCERTLSTCMWVPIFENQQNAQDPKDMQRRFQSSQQSHLVFWTSAAYLQIVSKPNTFTVRDQMNESKHLPLEYQIRNKHGVCIGHLTMTGSSPTQIEVNRHEFIVVSGAQFLGFNIITWKSKFSPRPNKWEMYNVLLVEWDVRKEVAYRIGLGRVLKSAWDGCNPKRKLVVLG